jgi:uroporphyrinogen-III synthase
LLLLRPEPGASASARRAAALGLRAIVAPLFTVRGLDWAAPDPAGVEAILLTSANAARHGGSAFTGLRCYAVGEATAAAARLAGYRDVRTGASDGSAAATMMARDGIGHALHLCGRDHVAVAAEGVTIDRRIVYAADPASALPPAAEKALIEDAIVLLHSSRAAALFAGLVGDRSRIPIAAISPAAAAAAGTGWASTAVARAPSDEALLELAAQLCKTERDEAG